MSTYKPEQLRKINQLVAAKVLNWEAVPCQGVWTNGWSVNGPFWSDSEGKTVCPIAAFSPSTDIAAAWETVKYLSKKDVAGWFNMHQCTDGTWAANFNSDDKLRYAETAPLAICLAALQVSDVDVEFELSRE